MGARGPAPTPTALKKLTGNPGKRPLNTAEPKPAAGIPSCPKELSPAAKKEWRRITRELKDLGILTKVDLAGLAAYCALFARWLEAEKKIVEEGAVVVTANGHLQQSPYLNIASGALKQMRGYLQEFGLSPSSRSRIKVDVPDEGKKGDPWNDLAKRRARAAGG